MTFKKGYDPNRAGSPELIKYKRTMRELMKDDAHLAVEYMFKVLKDPDTPVALGVKVAQDIQDRYYGKAVDRIQVQQINAIATGDVSAMKDSELELVISELVNNNAKNCIESESTLLELKELEGKQ